MNEWAGKGFRLLALSGVDGNLGLMERADGAPTSGPADQYVLLATFRKETMEKELAHTVASGYRVVAATIPQNEMLVALEKLAPGEPMPEYRVLSTIRSETLEGEIIAASREGYRVLPMALCHGAKSPGLAAILEKSPNSPPVQYKVLSTRRVSTLREELTETAAAGWSVNRLLPIQVVMLEKADQ